MDYKFYIPASKRYVNVNNDNDITLFQIFEGDGKQMSIAYQNGDPTLEVHEYISYGQIIEVWRQVRDNQREYDPYAIFPKELKKDHLQ